MTSTTNIPPSPKTTDAKHTAAASSPATDEATARKAQRALVILYVVMFIFILAPLALYFILKK